MCAETHFSVTAESNGMLSRLRLGYASAIPRPRLTYASTTPWLLCPASIVARHAITLIVRLGT